MTVYAIVIDERDYTPFGGGDYGRVVTKVTTKEEAEEKKRLLKMAGHKNVYIAPFKADKAKVLIGYYNGGWAPCWPPDEYEWAEGGQIMTIEEAYEIASSWYGHTHASAWVVDHDEPLPA